MLELIEGPLFFGLFGGIGQLVRAAYGVKNALDAGKEFEPKKLLASLGYAFLGGVVVGVFMQDWRAAFLAGISTSDMLEGLTKAVTGANKPAAPPA